MLGTDSYIDTNVINFIHADSDMMSMRTHIIHKIIIILIDLMYKRSSDYIVAMSNSPVNNEISEMLSLLIIFVRNATFMTTEVI